MQRESWKHLAIEGWVFVLIAIIAFVGGLVVGRLGGSTTTETVTVSAPSGESTEPSEAASADGAQFFTTIGCGSCHTMAAANATGEVGPNLEESLAPDDNTAGIEEMIIHPNSEVVEGYSANIMPQDYGQKLSSEEVHALATFLVANSAAKP